MVKKFGNHNMTVLYLNPPYQNIYKPQHVIFNNVAGILTSVDSEEPVQPPFKLRNSECFSVSSLTVIEYSSDKQML